MSKKKNEEKKEAVKTEQEKPVSDFENNNNGWTKISDGEVVKLEPGNSIEGLLVDKNISKKYNNCGIYKISVKNDNIPKVILGSKQLDRHMENIETGTHIKIVFIGTQPSDKGNPMKVFDVFKKE